MFNSLYMLNVLDLTYDSKCNVCFVIITVSICT
jgi:hypothetical protein